MSGEDRTAARRVDVTEFSGAWMERSQSENGAKIETVVNKTEFYGAIRLPAALQPAVTIHT